MSKLVYWKLERIFNWSYWTFGVEIRHGFSYIFHFGPMRLVYAKHYEYVTPDTFGDFYLIRHRNDATKQGRQQKGYSNVRTL